MSSITRIHAKVSVPEGTEFIEKFEHDGVEVTVVENLVTHRYRALFEDRRPTPFSTTAMQLQDVKRKAIRLIDKLHGNK